MNEDNPNIVIRNIGQHNHPPELRLIQQQQIVREMRDEIVNDPSVPVRRVYNAVIQVHQGNVDEDLPRFERVRSALNRTRADVVPPIPNNIEDVAIPVGWTETWQGDLIVCFQSNERGILGFATRNDLQLLARCETIFMDGTFRTAPYPYQ